MILGRAALALFGFAAAAINAGVSQTDKLPMRPGGISLYWERVRIGEHGRPLLLHIYVVPKDRLNHEGQPLSREDVRGGTSISDSPFYLELFDESREAKKPISSVPFVEDGDVNKVLVRWLRPKEKKGPVILMRFGVGDEGEWLIASYPPGPTHTPVLQHLGFGCDQTYCAKPHFDGIDRRGNLVIWEEYSEGESKAGIHRYRWNGRRFAGLRRGSGLE